MGAFSWAFFTGKVPFVSHEKCMKIPLIFNASGSMKKKTLTNKKPMKMP